jgi:hypothetical protein
MHQVAQREGGKGDADRGEVSLGPG